jgi:zinc transport system permease protein
MLPDRWRFISITTIIRTTCMASRTARTMITIATMTTTMRAIGMDDFFVRAVVAGLGVAAVTGPLGAFVVWRRMAFFGDALAHSGLLGIVLGLLLHVDPFIGVAAVVLAVAVLLVVLRRRGELAADTVLGILSHGTLALGLVAVSFLRGIRVDLLGFLFGDILAVRTIDVIWIYVLGAAVLAGLAVYWRPLLALTVHEDLAAVEGVQVLRVELVFMVLVAVVVAAAMKVVGIVLVAAMLVIPAAAARRFARGPEEMALLAALIGASAVAGGLGASLTLDTPAGPSIVVTALALFALSSVPLAASARQ